MGLFITDTSTEIILITTTLLIVIINHFRNAYTYWSKKGVPTIAPKFPLGNNNTILPRGFSVGTLSKTFYDEFKKQGHKFGGVYLVTAPNLVLVDPDYIKDVLTKDFQHFVDRGIYHNKKQDPLSAHLFAIDGQEWKNLRVKLTPTFTSGKMKMMFHSVVECCNYMKDAISKNLEQDIDIKEMLGRFTTDVIGSVAFGIECNSFKHPDAEFRQMGKQIFVYKLWKKLRAFCLISMPKLSLQLGFKSTTGEVRDFFIKIVEDTVKMRLENNVKRNDFLQLLIDMKESQNFSLEEIAAQVFVFFIAGFETSSTAMTYGLYELAKNQEIQKKLRMEIVEVLGRFNGKITYESLNEMKLLGRVFDETLRMYPPLVTLNRRCTKDYTLRDTDILIEKGTYVLISTLGLHRDPDHFPNPDIFDPDRFSDENKQGRHPFAYLPFGDGPRNCIGLRFGIMQSKIGIATLIKHFNFTLSPETEPVELDPYVFLLNSVDKVYLRAEKLC